MSAPPFDCQALAWRSWTVRRAVGSSTSSTTWGSAHCGRPPVSRSRRCAAGAGPPLERPRGDECAGVRGPGTVGDTPGSRTMPITAPAPMGRSRCRRPATSRRPNKLTNLQLLPIRNGHARRLRPIPRSGQGLERRRPEEPARRQGSLEESERALELAVQDHVRAKDPIRELRRALRPQAEATPATQEQDQPACRDTDETPTRHPEHRLTTSHRPWTPRPTGRR